jgi:hypothetical protein
MTVNAKNERNVKKDKVNKHLIEEDNTVQSGSKNNRIFSAKSVTRRNF